MTGSPTLGSPTYRRRRASLPPSPVLFGGWHMTCWHIGSPRGIAAYAQPGALVWSPSGGGLAGAARVAEEAVLGRRCYGRHASSPLRLTPWLWPHEPARLRPREAGATDPLGPVLARAGSDLSSPTHHGGTFSLDGRDRRSSSERLERFSSSKDLTAALAAGERQHAGDSGRSEGSSAASRPSLMRSNSSSSSEFRRAHGIAGRPGEEEENFLEIEQASTTAPPSPPPPPPSLRPPSPRNQLHLRPTITCQHHFHLPPFAPPFPPPPPRRRRRGRRRLSSRSWATAGPSSANGSRPAPWRPNAARRSSAAASPSAAAAAAGSAPSHLPPPPPLD